jgi:hypothetical protein
LVTIPRFMKSTFDVFTGLVVQEGDIPMPPAVLNLYKLEAMIVLVSLIKALIYLYNQIGISFNRFLIIYRFFNIFLNKSFFKALNIVSYTKYHATYILLSKRKQCRFKTRNLWHLFLWRRWHLTA